MSKIILGARLPQIKKNALWQPICAQIGMNHKAVSNASEAYLCL